MSLPPADEQWLRRADSLGRAQARYLWIGVIVGVFFFALRSASSQDIKVPLIELQLPTDAVLATGGPILAFLVVAITGSLKGWGNAMQAALGKDWRDEVERYDMHPTAFDLAGHTTRGIRVADTLTGWLTYPTLLLLLLGESAWLLKWLLESAAPNRTALLGSGVVLWIWGALFVAQFCWSRIKRTSSKGEVGAPGGHLAARLKVGGAAVALLGLAAGLGNLTGMFTHPSRERIVDEIRTKGEFLASAPGFAALVRAFPPPAGVAVTEIAGIGPTTHLVSSGVVTPTGPLAYFNSGSPRGYTQPILTFGQLQAWATSSGYPWVAWVFSALGWAVLVAGLATEASAKREREHAG